MSLMKISQMKMSLIKNIKKNNLTLWNGWES
jgi:hypothetical protein